MKPFRIDIPQEAIEDLRRRLTQTRWPSQIEGTGWSRGVPVDYLRSLAQAWADEFDWRAVESRLNQYPQFTTEIDGANIHFFHVRSPEPDATPLIMTHGWPGSVAEYLDVIGPLTDPRAHGGDPAAAYHLVIPTPPGFGFSGPTTEQGWDIGRIAAAWAELMARLGYEKYAVQGSDLGTWISMALSAMDHEHVIGAHVNFLLTPPPDNPEIMGTLTPEDFQRLGTMGSWITEKSAYMWVQSTRPQTLSYALTDSPVGQLAWMVEKFREWTDPAAELPEQAVDLDQLLTGVSVSWFTRAGASSAHGTYEGMQAYRAMVERQASGGGAPPEGPPGPPTGVAVFAADTGIRSLLDPAGTMEHWTEYDSGGHFPAMEVPELLTGDVRDFFRRHR